MSQEVNAALPRYVLDTEAFVLYLTAGEGGVIQRLLREAEAGRHEVLMNVYNIAEVYVRLASELSQEELDAVVRAAQALPIRRVSVSDALVFAAARLRASQAMTAATAMALATAQQEGAILVSGQALTQAPDGVAVRPLVGGGDAEMADEVILGLM